MDARQVKERSRAGVGMVLLGALAWLPLSVARAEESPAGGDQVASRLGVALDTTWVSKYVWRGYDLFDDHAALQPSVDVDLFGTGFSMNAWGAIPMGTGSNNQGGGINQWQEYDYTLAYSKTLFAEERYAVELGANYIYYDFPKLNHMADSQEIGASVALPNLLEIGGSALVPSYSVGKLWPTSSGVSDVAGGYHGLGLGYEVAVPETDLTLSFSGEVAYNDGLFGSDHDWSHSTFGVSTSVPAGPVTLTPFVYYQVSMDDSVNDEDEIYGGVSASISF